MKKPKTAENTELQRALDFDHRIYVILPEYLTIPGKPKEKLSSGKAAAQAAHVVSKLKLRFVLRTTETLDVEALRKQLTTMEGAGITTIILKARDEKELRHVLHLCVANGVDWVSFCDTNTQAYGDGVLVLTGIALGPVPKEKVKGIADYLPLWGSEV